jgi:tetratricopeptide (TPR) repeat protein
VLKDVVFISMEGKKDFKIGEFLINENIALPVYVKGNKQFTIDDLTGDNIVTGIIKVLTDDPDNENLDYYREFIFAVQPEIEARLTSVAYEAERNHHFDDALNIYKVLFSLKPDSIDHNLNIAICYDEYSQYNFSKGIDPEAEKLEEQSFQFFKKVEDYENKTERAYYYLGRFYFSRENFEKAMEYFNEFIKITDDEIRKKEVIKFLNEVCNEGVTDENYQNAVWLIQSDKENEAFSYIDKFIEKYPKSWNGFFIKGWAFRKLEKYKEAIECFEKAIKFNPDSPDVFNELGLCYMNTNVFYKSKLYFSKALKNNPEDLSIINNLALCSFKEGNKEEALKYCEIILEFNPDDLQTKKLLEIIKEDKKL